MKIILRYAFVSLYTVGGMLLLIECWKFFDLPFIPGLGTVLCICWLIVCYTGNYWLPGFFLAALRIRKTILEEEEWLHPLMHELNLRSGIDPVPELLILEKPELDAFAVGRKTVVLSRGLLVKLSEPEIKAVLAHEYGHLKDRDTLTATVFSIGGRIPSNLFRISNMLWTVVMKTLFGKVGLLKKLILSALLALLIISYPDMLMLAVFVTLMRYGFPVINTILMLCWFWLCRTHEFRQDSFAQSLGYGKHLKAALLKIDALDSGGLVNRIAQYWMTHPMLYMRIRRLEWLEGLRPTP